MNHSDVDFRLLAKPGFKAVSSGSSSPRCLYSRMSQLGVEIIEWTPMRMLFGTYDVLHLHWPDNVVYAPSAIVVAMKILLLIPALWWVRLRGKPIVWTAHNLESLAQRHPRLERLFWRLYLPLVDGVVAPGKSILERLLEKRQLRNDVVARAIPFGNWDDSFPNTLSREEARRQLGIPEDQRVAAFVGAIYRYKGIDNLLRAFQHESLQDCALFAMGAIGDDVDLAEMESLAAGNPHVRFEGRFVEPEEIQLFFNAADLCIYPFRHITNSGSARLGLTFNRPVLVPDAPIFLEYLETFGEEWIHLFPLGAFEAKHVVEAFEKSGSVRGKEMDWGEYNWETNAANTKQLMMDLLGR